MARINVVGDFFKSGLTEAEIQSTVKAVFDTLGTPLSFSGLNRGSRKNEKPDWIPASAGMTKRQGVGRNDKVLNIAFVEPEEIQKRNLEYRKKDSPTDVLSFDYGDEGDILLCNQKINEMKEADETLAEATQKTIIHGALHLYGFDHENEKDRAIMEKREHKVFKAIKHNRHSGDGGRQNPILDKPE